MKILFFGIGIKGLHVFESLLSRREDLNIEFLVLPSEPRKNNIKTKLKSFLKYKRTPEYEMKSIAKKNKIPVIYYGKTSDLVNGLKGVSVDLGIIASFNKILSKEVINIPKNGIINIHSSTLPNHRGANPIFWAIKNGESIIGSTIHFVSEEFDRGEVILQDEIRISNADTYKTVERKILPLQIKLLMQAISNLVQGNLISFPQNGKKGSYDPVPKESDYTIDWDNESKNILNLIRASDEFNGAITYIGENRYRIMTASLVDSIEEYDKIAGTIIRKTKEGIFVKTKDGSIFSAWKNINPIKSVDILEKNSRFTNRI